MFRRIPRVRQHDVSDCGAACLLSVARHYGLDIPLTRIRQYAGTDRAGTNVLGMLEAAKRLGFAAKGVKGSGDALRQIPLPAIAHVVKESGLHHYVVIYGRSRDRLILMEPQDGTIVRTSIEVFSASWSGVLILLAPSAGFEPSRLRSSTPGRFWSLLRPHRSLLAQALVGAAAYTILGLSTAVYIQKIVDHVLIDGDLKLLNLMTVGMLALLLAQVYLGTMKSLIGLRTGQRIDAALLIGYYHHLLRLPQRFFDTMRVGEIVARVGDAVKIRSFISDAALEISVNLLVVAFSLSLMLAYDWRLALAVGAAIPLYAIVLAITDVLNRRTLRAVMESGAELESHLVETISGSSTLKRFGLCTVAEHGLERKLVKLLRGVFTAGSISIFASRGCELISRCSVIALFWVGSRAVIGGEITPGELMSFYALLGYLTGPVTGLVGANRSIRDAVIAADRLYEILDLEREEETGLTLGRSDVGDIVFRDVNFRYGNRARIFSGLTLRITRGAMTAVVGESGSGKSTAVSILQKLYPVESGSVHIGAHDLRHVSAESLRRLVVAVPQDFRLLSGTVLENIAPADPQPDLGRVLRICEDLGVSDFVSGLPNGFGTRIGEGSIELSGGQRQRLAVARALYAEPEVLILDEATSNLDPLSEKTIHRVVRGLRDRGVTVVFIAHRLRTVADADRIFVLLGGRVAEEGRHEELLARRGRYFDLWQAQEGSGERTENHLLVAAPMS